MKTARSRSQNDLSIDAAYWQWAVKTRPGRSVCFSSSAAYPIALQRETSHVLLKEDMIGFDDQIGMPDMTYGWAKLTMEYLGRLAYQKHGLKSVVYRPFSGYGEDQDDAYPFPSICKRAMQHRGQERLSVWGAGTQMRDFIHIDDCIEGIVTTMDQIDNGDAINLSTGILTSFIDFARIAADVCGYAPLIYGMSGKPEGVFARGGDTTKQASLGFQPPSHSGPGSNVQSAITSRKRPFRPKRSPDAEAATNCCLSPWRKRRNSMVLFRRDRVDPDPHWPSRHELYAYGG